MSRQKILLYVLIGVVLLTGIVYLSNGDETAPPAGVGRGARRVDGETGMAVSAVPAAQRSASSSADAREAVRFVVPLRIGDLDRTPPSFTAGRDPWRFVEPPPPPPPAKHVPSAAELRAMQEAEAARQRLAAAAAAAAAVEQAKPRPAQFTWNYIGSFGPPNQRIAVFVDGQKVWNAREGETLQGKFIVSQIGYESVDIRFVGFPDWPAQRLAVKH
jgi:hypothetical protein